MRSIFPFLFLLPVTAACQNEARTTLFEHLLTVIQLESQYYEKIEISGSPIPWDTTARYAKELLLRADTTNAEAFPMRHKPTRKMIVAFMRLLREDDYTAFKHQIAHQYSTPFEFPRTIKIKKVNKLQRGVLTVQLSQPLFTADQKVAIISVIESTEYSYYSSVRVYIRYGVTWILWNYLFLYQIVS
jgi:hypothetical protein